MFVLAALVAFHPRWSGVGRINLHPLAFMTDLGARGNSYFELRNVLGNVVLYAPAALAATLVLEDSRAVVLLVGAVAVWVEVGQLALGDRVVDIDDVILAMFGAFVVAAATNAVRRRWSPRRG